MKANACISSTPVVVLRAVKSIPDESFNCVSRWAEQFICDWVTWPPAGYVRSRVQRLGVAATLSGYPAVTQAYPLLLLPVQSLVSTCTRPAMLPSVVGAANRTATPHAGMNLIPERLTCLSDAEQNEAP
jgi:hypothetical protein